MTQDKSMICERGGAQPQLMADLATQICSMVERIKPILAGHPPPVQSAVLADLLAVYLAGFWAPGNAEATRRVRAEALAAHCELVRQLTPVNATIMGTSEEAPGS